MSETELNAEIVAHADAVATVAELGALATKPRRLDAGAWYAFPDGRGGVRTQQVPAESYNPERIVAVREVTDALSFVTYLERHGTTSTEVFADVARATVVAVLDGHEDHDTSPQFRAGRGTHRVRLVLEQTPSWKAWAALNGQLGGQETFAEHLEENLADVVEPDGTTLLEIAQTFQATRGVDFGQATRLSNGETQIRYSETLDGKAGRKGDLVIPDEFVLGLIPFVGGREAYKVIAKLRWRLRDANLSIGYRLLRPDRVLEDAFRDVLAEIEAGIEQPILAGRP